MVGPMIYFVCESETNLPKVNSGCYSKDSADSINELSMRVSFFL